MEKNDDKNIASLLKGKLFDASFIFENYKIISFFVALAFVSAYSSHSVDKKIYHVTKLQKDVRELKSEFVSVRTELMNSRMGSSMQEKVKDLGLESSTVPPQIIKVKKDE